MTKFLPHVVAAIAADELDYTLSVSGDLFGGASGVDLALGGGNLHADDRLHRAACL